MMHLRGLKEAVKKAAGKGKYHCVQHRIFEYHTGEIRHEWAAYTEDIGWTLAEHLTPELALAELKERCSTLK